jgi:uncharacterized membrane protein (UPF0127 family)/Flp pilus assembly protein TadG
MTSRQHTVCTLFTATGTHGLSLRTAGTFMARFRGLMLSPPLERAEGMLIVRCTSVHSAFMRYAIDVVYLDRHGIVTRCVPNLHPWRASDSRFGGPRATHTLELAAGAIAAFSIAPGDRLSHPCFEQGKTVRSQLRTKERGSAMIEFAVVGPLIALFGLGTLQYGMVFFAKNQINYATFMAAREGAFAHADLGTVQQAYMRALAPMYGGGENPAELAQSVAKASADMADNMQIEMLNPTKESFSEWNDETLQALLKTGNRHVIPNSALVARISRSSEVRASSGQSLQDANLLKLKITHGYVPKVPVIGKLYLALLKWGDQHADSFQTKLISNGRIPVVTHVTLGMQSDAIEPDSPISIPGAGNGGHPAGPGTPPVTDPVSPPPEPVPACNPFIDPNHCQTPECVPNSQMCCIPPEFMPKK